MRFHVIRYYLKFPKYTVADMVRAQYLLFTRHLDIDHLAGVMGASMGGRPFSGFLIIRTLQKK